MFYGCIVHTVLIITHVILVLKLNGIQPQQIPKFVFPISVLICDTSVRTIGHNFSEPKGCPGRFRCEQEMGFMHTNSSFVGKLSSLMFGSLL